MSMQMQEGGESQISDSKRHTLVPDILFDIFLSITAREDLVWIQSPHSSALNTIIRHRYFDSTHDLRRLTQVCQYWRDVALNSPKLWSQHVDCTNLAPKWFKEIVYRSQDVPLLVTVGRPHTPRPFANHTLANLEFLLKSEKHFSELHIDLVMQALPIKISLLERLRQPMPGLIKCTFFYFPEEEETARLQDPAVFDLFSGSAPPWLRKMYIRGCLPHVQHKLLEPLTHLCLLDCHAPDLDWVSFLQHTPHLEELIITVNPVINQDSASAPSSVDLPYLTSLYIEGDYIAAGRLLDALNPTQIKTLGCQLNNISYRFPRVVLDPLKRLLPPNTDIDSANETTIFLRIDDFRIKVVAEGGFALSLDLRTYGIYSQASYLSILMNACLPLFSSCRHLVLDGLKGDVDRLTNDPLFVILLPFSNTSTVTFTKATHARLLKPRIYTSARFPRLPILFPALDTLILCCSIVKFFEDTEAFLAHKIGQGHPVRKILFPVSGHINSMEKQSILSEKYSVEILFYGE